MNSFTLASYARERARDRDEINYKTHMRNANCFFCISNAKKPAVFLGVSQIDPKKCGRMAAAVDGHVAGAC
jgi:hypothetical protein